MIQFLFILLFFIRFGGRAAAAVDDVQNVHVFIWLASDDQTYRIECSVCRIHQSSIKYGIWISCPSKCWRCLNLTKTDTEKTLFVRCTCFILDKIA